MMVWFFLFVISLTVLVFGLTLIFSYKGAEFLCKKIFFSHDSDSCRKFANDSMDRIYTGINFAIPGLVGSVIFFIKLFFG